MEHLTIQDLRQLPRAIFGKGEQLFWHPEHGTPCPDPLTLYSFYEVHGGDAIIHYRCSNLKCYCQKPTVPGKQTMHYMFVDELGYDRDHKRLTNICKPVFTSEATSTSLTKTPDNKEMGERCLKCKTKMVDGPRASLICPSCGKVVGGF